MELLSVCLIFSLFNIKNERISLGFKIVTCSKFIQRQWLLLLKVLMLLQMLTLVQQVKLYGCITMKVKITSSQVLLDYCKHFTHS